MALTVFPIMEMLLRVVVHSGLQKQILLLVPVVPIVGYMNPSASNYDPLANTNTFGGIFDPNGGSGAYFNGNRHLLVDANVPAKIVSADVYSNSSSNTITFELRDNTSSVIDDTTLTLVQGQQRINLNFDIPVGNNYELGISSSNTSPGLYRSNDAAFVNYPLRYWRFNKYY